jgi:hypothetical protein
MMNSIAYVPPRSSWAPWLSDERLRVVLRFALGTILVGYYGTSNLFPASHYPFPTLDEMARPVSSFSPWQLFRAYMGVDQHTMVFIGLTQIVSGALLFFRKTTLLGAVIAVGVLTNVAAASVGYQLPDAPLAVVSLLTALLVLLPDVQEVVDALVFNRPSHPRPLPAPVVTRRSMSIPWANVGYATALFLASSIYWYSTATANERPRSPLWGLYAVDSLVENGISRAPLLTDSTRWHSLVFSTPDRTLVRFVTDSLRSYTTQFDTATRSLELASSADRPVFRLSYSQPAPETLILDGTRDGKPVHVRLSRINETQTYPLLTSAFAELKFGWDLARGGANPTWKAVSRAGESQRSSALERARDVLAFLKGDLGNAP